MLLSVVSRGAAAIVNSDTVGTQTSPAVATDANGDSIVVWKDARQEVSPTYESDIRAQRYSPSGAPVHKDGSTAGIQEFQLNAEADAQFIERDTPAVAMDANGDFVVAWKRSDTTTTGNYIYEIQARVFNAAGAALTGDINVTANNHNARNQPSVAMDNSGNWVITWSDQGTGPVNGNDIFAKKFSLTGTPLALNGSTNPLQVNTGAAAAANQFSASVAADAVGDFVVTWTSFDPANPAPGQEAFAQRFNSAGVAQGSLIHVNTTTTGNQGESRVAMTPAGDFIIAWDNDLNDGSNTRGDIFYKRYNADGTLRNNPTDVDLQANATSVGFQQAPGVGIDANGNATISWNTTPDNTGTFGLSLRRINAQGQPIEGSDIPIGTVTGTNQDMTGVAVDSQGDVAAVYRQQTGSGPSTNFDIFAQFFKYVNDAPTLTQPGNLTINENAGQQTVNLAGITAGGPAGASNPESQTLTVAVSSNNTALIPTPAVNYTSPGATGTLTFTPAANTFGTATITVTVTDNGGTANGGINQVVETFTVTVNAVASPPTANDQSVNVPHDTAKAVTLTGSDPNTPPHALTFTIVTNPTHGTLSGFNSSTGAVTYTPTAGYQGADSFTFKDNNGTADSNTATVSLTVAAATPTANNQTVAVAHNTATAVTLTGNDGNDNPALPLTFGVATNPAHGTLSGFNAATGAVTYTPAAGFHGTDSLTFTTSNGQKTSTAATVTLNVAVGTPTANPQSVNVAHNSSGAAITLTATDDDTPALAQTFAIVAGQGPSHGTLSGFNAATGAVTYTPAAGFHGADSFKFTSSNGTNTSAAATVTLAVATGTPTANPQTVSTNQDTPLNITLTGTDDDSPALPLTFATVSGQGPSHGTLSGFNAATGAVTYTPAAGYSGGDSFQFTVSNGTNTSTAATITITVASTTSAPSITTSPSNQSVIAGQTATFTASASGTPTPTVQWQVSTDGGHTFAAIPGATSTTLSFAATIGENGDEYEAVFTNTAGSATSNPATLTVQQATVASSVGVAWGTAGTATLGTDADGLRLLASGRKVDLPWLGINRISITLNAAESLSPADVSVTGTAVADYGPVTITGSGTSYTITLARAIDAADRVTVTIGNAGIATFTRRLDVLPGDVNDDGAVSLQDAILVRNMYLGVAGATPTIFGDINGDGVVDVNDYNLIRQRVGTHLT